jgi:hypothetical protein
VNSVLDVNGIRKWDGGEAVTATSTLADVSQWPATSPWRTRGRLTPRTSLREGNVTRTDLRIFEDGTPEVYTPNRSVLVDLIWATDLIFSTNYFPATLGTVRARLPQVRTVPYRFTTTVCVYLCSTPPFCFLVTKPLFPLTH